MLRQNYAFTTNLKALAQQNIEESFVYDIKQHVDIITEGIIRASKQGQTNYKIYISKSLEIFNKGFTNCTIIYLDKDSRFTLEQVYDSLYNWLCSNGFCDKDIIQVYPESNETHTCLVYINWEKS